ncbi:hypothetical protein [Streptomyces tauricus]|uniref:hypothetical protein n=1 Tax=Streptomyces tauricus TaxID=68274 RepID=UPI0034487232
MSQYLTALTGAGMVVAVAVTTAARMVRPPGRHRSPLSPIVPPVELMGSPSCWLACDSPRCGHLQTIHTETSEDVFECSGCGRVRGGGS